MRVHLVRHACAGRKVDWDGPDALRPLDPIGRHQAHHLADHLDGVPLRRVLTSPALRCVETVEEVAARHGLVPEPTPLLATDADPAELLRLVADPSCADAVLCTHGETMKGLLPLVRAMATDVRADADDDERLLLKGSVWTLGVDPGATPPIVALHHTVPSAIESCAAHPSEPAADPVPHGT